jgi:hypothetical protein
MTRETKIGMVIATTFLSLVGLVVASKMRQPEPASEVKPAGEGSSAPLAAANPLGNGVHSGQPSDAPAGQSTGPPAVVPPHVKENEPPQTKKNGQTTNGGKPAPTNTELPIVQLTGGPAPLAETKPPLPLAPELLAKPNGELPAVDAKPYVLAAPNEPKGFGAIPPVTDPPLAPAPLKVAAIAEPGTVGLPQQPPISLKDQKLKDPLANDQLPKDPLANDLLPKDPLANDLLPAKPIGLPELPTVNGPFGNTIQPPPVQPTEPVKQKPDPPITPVPTPNTVPANLDVKVGNPTPPDKKSSDPMAPPLIPRSAIPPVPPAPTGESIGTIGNTGSEIRVTAPVMPGSPGQIPGAGVPQLPAASGNLPKVTSYEEKTHVVPPGVTSFDELSKALFGTPDYGQALQEYNRQHVLAAPNAGQNPPVVQANQQIYYPPKNILEIQYPQLIKHAGAAPAAPALAVKISAPTPLVGPGSVPGANPPTADATVDYRVAQPQFIYDIARQQLGDGLLWPEILRLNPALHTDQPIPAGTELRLPKAR